MMMEAVVYAPVCDRCQRIWEFVHPDDNGHLFTDPAVSFDYARSCGWRTGREFLPNVRDDLVRLTFDHPSFPMSSFVKADWHICPECVAEMKKQTEKISAPLPPA